MLFVTKKYTMQIDEKVLEIRKSETILKALKRQGVDPPYFCEGGACGVCCLFLKNGSICDTRDDTVVECVNDEKLIYACVSKPLSDISISYSGVSKAEEREDLLKYFN